MSSYFIWDNFNRSHSVPRLCHLLFSASIHTSEITDSIVRRYENSAGRNTSGTSAVLLSVDVKCVKTFLKDIQNY